MSLKVEHVSKTYLTGAQEITVLDDVSLEINEGELVALLGPSGSGKSTLLSILSGLTLPSKGKVIINGVSLTNISEEQRTQWRGKNLGFIFQNFQLASHLNAIENVLLPFDINGSSQSYNAKELLAKVGLKDRMGHFPSQLSGGEKQRVALARAIINKPALILADEPTGSLDEQTASAVSELLFETVKALKQTTIIVTHNEALAEKCDRIYRLTHGKLVQTK